MRQIYLFSLFLVLPTVLIAQTLKAKVYDSESTVKGIKVYNKTQDRITGTDENGDFKIEAKISDTLTFQSLFHHPKAVVLTKAHFRETIVFELEKIVNELDEVEIKAETEQPVFEVNTYNANLNDLIKEDIKNNLGLYQSANAAYRVDFVYLIGQVIKLFKRKDKYKAPVYQPISYEQLDSLTSKSSFFNDRFLTETLKIPKDKKYLFFEFVEAKQISEELLKETKKMQLLEELFQISDLFLILLEEYGEKKEIKD